MARKVQQSKKNELSNILISALRILGKDSSWLAEKISTYNKNVNRYIDGKRFPSEKILSDIYSVLYLALEEKFSSPSYIGTLETISSD